MTSLTNLLIPKETNWFVAKNSKIDHLDWSEQSGENLNQMTHFDLVNSSIYSIGQHFFGKLANSSKVQYLNLTSNKLKGFNQDIRKNNLSEVYLSGNPIDCHCDMF